MIVTIHYNEGLDLDSEQFTGVTEMGPTCLGYMYIVTINQGEGELNVIKIEDISYIEII